jgi:predicted SprT family Zn-dependent metalloprotease
VTPVKITFSRQFIEKGSQKDLMDVILHEIAHALVPHKSAHNHVWAAKCREIGLKNPTPCTEFDSPIDTKNYKLFCLGGCDLTVTRKGHRLPTKYKNSVHRPCGKGLYWKEVYSVV